MAEGLLSGLGGVIGRGLLGGTGITAGRRAEATRKAALLKQGLDPSRMRDKEYVSAQAERGQNDLGELKGEFAYAQNVIQSPTFKNLPKVDQDRWLAFADTKAKGFDTLQGQAQATSFGRGRGTAQATDVDELGNMESKMPELTQTIGRLKELGDKATYTRTGQFADAVKREFGMPMDEGAIARTEYQSVVNNQVLPLLRDTFGAAFTVQEGESLKATLGDPNKSPEEKERVLNAFITQKTNDIISKKRKIGMPEQSTGGIQETSFDDLWGE